MEHEEGSYGEEEEGYSAGESFEEGFDIPDYVEGIRDRLNEVRAALGKVNEARWGAGQSLGTWQPPDPIKELQYEQACAPLHK